MLVIIKHNLKFRRSDTIKRKGNNTGFCFSPGLMVKCFIVKIHRYFVHNLSAAPMFEFMGSDCMF